MHMYEIKDFALQIYGNNCLTNEAVFQPKWSFT